MLIQKLNVSYREAQVDLIPQQKRNIVEFNDILNHWKQAHEKLIEK
jgi:hypothetical protein